MSTAYAAGVMSSQADHRARMVIGPGGTPIAAWPGRLVSRTADGALIIVAMPDAALDAWAARGGAESRLPAPAGERT